MSKRDRLQAARLASWPHPLLPPSKDRLPRASLRTIEGASFVRDRPDLARRTWLEEQHRRCTRAASRWLNL